MRALGSTAVRDPQHTQAFPWLSWDEPSAQGRWAPKRTVYSRKCPVICCIAGRACPALMPAGPEAVLCAGAGADSALSLLPCNAVTGTHNVQECREIKSRASQGPEAAAL